jgi:SP family arabinose:H+ symporter-like MFS transporter
VTGIMEPEPTSGTTREVRSTGAHLIVSVGVGTLGGLLFGFDTAVIAGTTHDLTRTFHLSPGMLGITVSIALLGTIIGSLGVGTPGQRFGSRAVLRYMAVLYLVSALGCAFAWSWPVLLCWRFIGGLGIGGSSVLGPVYIAEIAPARHRGRFVGMFQFSIVAGVLLAYLSNYLLERRIHALQEWRWELGVAGAPALLFLILLFRVSESPRWLLSRGRGQQARQVLERMGCSNPEETAEAIETYQAAPDQKHKTPFFQRRYRLPILLAISVGLFNQLSGINAILYYLNDIFRSGGFESTSSSLQAIIVGALNLLATGLALTVIDVLGRRPLLLFGSAGMAVSLSAIASVMFGRLNHHYLLPCLATYTFCFAFSQGAVIWVYLSEIFPTAVRAKGQSLGASVHWIANAIISGLFPVIATKSAGYPFAFFAIMMVVQIAVVFFFYPETKRLSLEQLEEKLDGNARSTE